MTQVIKTHRFDFEGKELSEEYQMAFERKVASAIVLMSGFSQEFKDGENVRNASVYVTLKKNENLVDLTAVLDIQPTNTKSRGGWIDAVIIAQLEKG